MNVTPEVAEYVEGRAHAVRFFRTDKSTFSGKYGEVTPYRGYTCCLQEEMQEKLMSAEIKALPEAERFAAAWEEVRYCEIRRFVSIAQSLCRWEELRKRRLISTGCEDFTDTGWTDMRTVVASIARSFDLDDTDVQMVNFVKWTFSVDYHWRMLRLFRILQRTDDREDKISPAMVRAMDGLVLNVGGEPSIYTRVFTEAYFSGYLFPRESVHNIVGTIFGRMIKPDFGSERTGC